MNLSVGIVGLPNVGKSTLFNALLSREVAHVANYPFATIDPNVGVVEVPDERLGKLAEVVRQTEHVKDDFKILPASVEFVDIAGLVKGAASGEGLGNQFLSHIRDVDAIVLILRDFSDENVVRSGSVEPKSDKEILETELILKDLETVTRALDRLESEVRGLKPPSPIFGKVETVKKIKEGLEKGQRAIDLNLTGEELWLVSEDQLLTAKPFIYVLNSDEGDLTKEPVIAGAIRISAKIESELAKLSKDEQREYLSTIGVEKSALERLIRAAFETLGLIVFFTAGPKEVRAWPVKNGAKAPQAAGTIHSDFEKGFIRVDVVPFGKFLEAPGWVKAKERGFVRTEGKDYSISDGDVVYFHTSA